MAMVRRVAESGNDKGGTDFHLTGFPTWEDYEALAHVLEGFGARMVDSFEAVYLRERVYVMDDLRFVLMHYDELGNYMYVENPTGPTEDELRRIAQRVDVRMRT